MLDRSLVHNLGRFRSEDAPVLSVYLGVPAEPGQRKGVKARLTDLLHPARDLAYSDEHSGQLSHYARESLRADIDTVMDLVERAGELAGRSVGIFACHQANFYEEVVMPRLVRDRSFIDATPHIRPLLAVLDELHSYCTLVVDREHAWFYLFFQGDLWAADKETDKVLRQPNYAGFGGLDEHRVHQKAEQLFRRHYRRTAERLEEFMRANGAELLIVGGHEEVLAEFLPYLPRGLQPRLAGIFVVDPGTTSPGRIREQADKVAEAYERREEQQLVADVVERVATGGFGAIGLEWCLLAVDEKAVQLLLIHDDEQVPGLVCDNCGWLGRPDPEQVRGDECPVCGSQLRKAPDVIDEMAAAVLDASGSVEHVYSETPLSHHLVGAQLRFPVPEPPFNRPAVNTAG